MWFEFIKHNKENGLCIRTEEDKKLLEDLFN